MTDQTPPETALGAIIFKAMDQTGVSHMTAVKTLQNIAGSIIAATAKNPEEMEIACSMAGSWLREGIEAMHAEMAKDVKQGMN